MKKKLLLSSLLVLSLISYQALSQFTIDAEYRPMGEVRNGYKKVASPDNEPAYFISQRSRLNFSYNNENLKAKLSLQDVRLWGDENVYNPTGPNGKTNGLTDIFESWIDFNVFKNSSIKIGRQVFNYDDMRLLSGRNRWQTGLSYDALLFKYSKPSKFDLHIGLSYNSNIESLNGNNYNTDRLKTLNFLYLKTQVSEKLYLSLTAIASGNQSEDNTSPYNNLNFMGTEGIHINYNDTKGAGDGLFFKGNAYIQNGKNKTGKEVKAAMATAYLGYRMFDKKLSIGGGVDYLSGNDASDSSVDYIKYDHSFDLLYGARFPYYGGYINQIIINDKHLKGGGLVNSYIKMKYIMSKKTSLMATLHNNRLATNVVAVNDPGNEYYDKDLGTNIDLELTSAIKKDIQLKIGGSYALPSDSFTRMSNVTDSNGEFNSGDNYYMWVMLTVKPTFFKN